MKRGFTIIESLIYISCSMIIISLFAILTMRLSQQVRYHINRAHNFLEIILGFDRLISDLQQSSCNQEKWKRKEKHEIVFNYKNKDCAWLIEKNRLIRCQGYLNKTQSRWNKKVKSVVIEQAEQILFKLIKAKSEIIGVVALLTIKDRNKAYTNESFIAPRLGIKL